MFLKRNKESVNSLRIREVQESVCYLTSTSKEYIYILNGKYYGFLSDRAFSSWRLDAVEIHSLPPIHQTDGGTLGFRNGTLIQNAKDGRIYLISGTKRHLLTAPLGDYGFDYSQVIEVSDAEIQFHAEGEDI